jgi:hypothetical protein
MNGARNRYGVLALDTALLERWALPEVGQRPLKTGTRKFVPFRLNQLAVCSATAHGVTVGLGKGERFGLPFLQGIHE